MIKKALLLASILALCSAAHSQSNMIDKKMEKAQKLVEKGKLTDADEYMVKLLEEYPGYGSGWDYLCKIRYKEYNESKQSDNLLGSMNITVTTKDKDGKDVEKKDDSLANNLMELLTNMKPSKTAFDKYKYTMRKATLVSQDAYVASQNLRIYFIDPEVDTAVSKRALKYYNDAEEEFAKKNYNEAAKFYRRAIELQPDFYKASLYLGDCFYFMGNYIEAISSFKSAVDKFPGLLEPRKYLIDAYAKERLYDKAIEESVAAMAVYPDHVIAFAKMDDAAYLSEKKIAIKWTPRGVFPNKMVPDSLSKDINRYKAPQEDREKQPWSYYIKSHASIQSVCDQKGVIVKPTSLTKAKYMEVFGWEEMLKNSNDPALEEARRMQKDGYLDCYVLVTCFHFDFYDQYAHFASLNKARIKEYYKKYIVAK